MRIDGISSNPAAAANALKHSKPAKDPDPVESTEPVAAEQPESEEKLPGVIRLLQEGHFKGVADVRLRINHYEKLQALESQNLRSVAAGGFDGFNQTVEDQIAALKESGLLTEDQSAALDSFLEDILLAQNGFMNGEGASYQEMIDSFAVQLDALVSGLLAPPEPIVDPQASEPEEPVEPAEQPPIEEAASVDEDQQPPTEEAVVIFEEEQPAEEVVIEPMDVIPAEPEPVEPAEQAPVEEAASVAEDQQPVEEVVVEPMEVIPTEPEPTEPSPLQQLVESFQQSVQQAIDDLQSGLSGASSLPPISEPSGNGGAFAKFLAIYESMQAGGVNPTASETTDAEEIIEEPTEEVIETQEPEPLSELA